VVRWWVVGGGGAALVVAAASEAEVQQEQAQAIFSLVKLANKHHVCAQVWWIWNSPQAKVRFLKEGA